MRLSRAGTVCILLGFALLSSSCGEDGAPADGAAKSTASTASASSTGGAPPSAKAVRSCRRRLGPFLATLETLRDDLARGLSYADYLKRVRGARAVYAKVRPKRVPTGCLVVSGGPAESAFNLYIEAANVWGGCLATVGCDTPSIEPRLQRKWALAERRLAAGQRGLSPPRGS